MNLARFTCEGRWVAPKLMVGMLVTWVLIAAACATKPKEGVSAMDNPWHHYTQGMEALEMNDQGLAEEKFDRALALDRSFAPALAGKALASATRSTSQTDPDHGRTDIEKADDLMDEAEDEAETQEQRFINEVAAMRIYTAIKPKKWISEVEDDYEDAIELRKLNEAKLPYYQSRDAAPYFMGVARYEAYNFREAEVMLVKVIGARAEGKWQPKANQLYRKVQRIVRASAGYTMSDVAAKIAVKDEVTRGDVAALIVSELKVDRLFAGRIPVKSEVAARKPEFTPIDVKGHPFQNEIETVMKWDIRGLAATYDASSRAWLFRPQEGVTRKELALIFEDVLIRLVGDESMATSMIGTDQSPYPDVPSEAAWFNAVSTVTSRGLMEPDLSGEFRPDDPANGSELLLGVFKLRYVVNIR